jgi:5-methyltetrahydrofolate--homocysteine methyltransferase
MAVSSTSRQTVQAVMQRSLLETIAERVLLADGAMGTQQQRAGLEPGGSGEAWNVANPDAVLTIQRGYVEAGSDCLLSNTFGACRIMLERHSLADRVEEINARGVALARAAFAGRPGYVIGDMGPFGGLMEPYGEVPQEAVVAAFREQAAALVRAGADAVIIETQTALEEIGLGIAAAREAGAACVIASMAFDLNRDGKDVRTMMGVRVEQAAEVLQEAGADILAINCGTGVDMAWAARILQRYRSASDLPLMAKPNNGLPELIDMQVVYRQTPQQMVVGLDQVLAAGARIVGGCCGTTAQHVRRFRGVIDAWNG